MQKGKIYLTKEKETYLATLYGKALDSCEFRIDPPYTVRWYDIDMPDVIKLRRRLYPERHDYTLVGSSVTDLHWLDEIPADRPVLVVAEGLVQYLSEKEGLALFNRITEKFPSGEFIFDAYSRLTIKLISLLPTVKEAHVSLQWGINDPYELENQVPNLKTGHKYLLFIHARTCRTFIYVAIVGPENDIPHYGPHRVLEEEYIAFALSVLRQ